jgi:hypothetical protein
VKEAEVCEDEDRAGADLVALILLALGLDEPPPSKLGTGELAFDSLSLPPLLRLRR